MKVSTKKHHPNDTEQLRKARRKYQDFRKEKYRQKVIYKRGLNYYRGDRKDFQKPVKIDDNGIAGVDYSKYVKADPNQIPTQAYDEDALTASICRESFYDFVQEFWSVVSPEAPVWNWHIEFLCQDLQRMAERVFKGLPKEFDAVINVPPGTTKPVWEEMKVLMGNGTYRKLSKVQVGDYVIGKSGKPCKVTAVHKQGKLPCVSLKTFAGRDIVTALDHPILTTNGWTEAGDIRPNDVLALMHKPTIMPTTKRSTDEFTLAGYLIGDGCCTEGACCLTNKDPEYIDDFVACIGRLGFGHSIMVDKNGITRISLKVEEGGLRADGPRNWMRDVGLYGKTSKTKKIPNFVWKGSDEQIKAFLAAYFHCDGGVHYKDSGKRNIKVAACTISKELAVGLQRLFLRLGISMNLRERVAKNGFAYNRGLKNYVYYLIETFDQDTAARFLKIIPLIGPKARKLVDFEPHKRTFDQKYWPDRVKQVESVGKLPCRCLTVEGDKSFVVEGVVVHNSTIFSVMFEAWAWTRYPQAQFICGSYSRDLAMELARKNRDVITSEKYKRLFPEVVLREDQNTKANFVNTKGGKRYSVGSGSSVIGMHAHFIVIDDPIDPRAAISDAELNEINRWISQTLSGRKVDKEIVPTILVMQRLNQNDPSGYKLAKRGALRHICLPAEEDDNIKPPELRANYVDGLLDPIRLTRHYLEEEKKEGAYYYSGQYQQNPVPLGGGMFKTDRLVIDYNPPLRFNSIVRFWDKAATLRGGAYTVGVLMGKDAKGRFWILDVIRGQWDSFTREDKIVQTAQMDGSHIIIGIEQEPGSGGKDSVVSSISRLAGYRVRPTRAVQDKVLRADPFSVQVNAGNVWLKEAPWNKEFVDELKHFPKSKYKDQVDASSGAFSLVVTGVLLHAGAL